MIRAKPQSCTKPLRPGTSVQSLADDALDGAARCQEELKDFDQALQLYRELVTKYPASESRPHAAIPHRHDRDVRAEGKGRRRREARAVDRRCGRRKGQSRTFVPAWRDLFPRPEELRGRGGAVRQRGQQRDDRCPVCRRSLPSVASVRVPDPEGREVSSASDRIVPDVPALVSVRSTQPGCSPLSFPVERNEPGFRQDRIHGNPVALPVIYAPRRAPASSRRVPGEGRQPERRAGQLFDDHARIAREPLGRGSRVQERQYHDQARYGGFRSRGGTRVHCSLSIRAHTRRKFSRFWPNFRCNIKTPPTQWRCTSGWPTNSPTHRRRANATAQPRRCARGPGKFHRGDSAVFRPPRPAGEQRPGRKWCRPCPSCSHSGAPISVPETIASAKKCLFQVLAREQSGETAGQAYAALGWIYKDEGSVDIATSYFRQAREGLPRNRCHQGCCRPSVHKRQLHRCHQTVRGALSGRQG